jgi:hypothetical protein
MVPPVLMQLRLGPVRLDTDLNILPFLYRLQGRPPFVPIVMFFLFISRNVEEYAVNMGSPDRTDGIVKLEIHGFRHIQHAAVIHNYIISTFHQHYKNITRLPGLK